MRYSTLYFSEQVILPRELLQEMQLLGRRGNRVAMRFDRDARTFHIWKIGKRAEPKFPCAVNRRGGLRVPERLVRVSGMQSGDVLDLTLQGDVLLAKVFDRDSVPDEMKYVNEIGQRKAPPGWICQAFTSNPSSTAYAQAGDAAVDNFDELLSRQSVDYRDFENVLDFGCGAGRVLSVLDERCDASLYGIDLHQGAIEWCQINLEYGQFSVGQEMPPLDFEDDQFDFIYAISVFTHLNEAMQDAWLAEFKRISQPGALLILSYRGEDYISSVLDDTRGPEIADELGRSNGFVFTEHTKWDGILPSYYCDSFHSHSYIEQHWGTYFEVLELIPSGQFSNRQNAAVLRNTL